MNARTGDRWGLAKWAAVATIIGTIVAIIGLFVTKGGRDAPASFIPVPTDARQPAASADPNSTGSPANTTTTSSVIRYLSHQSYTNDPEEIPYFNGYAEGPGSQEVNGEQFVRSINFPYACSVTSGKFADYNLGRHFRNFVTTIGPSDISKSEGYNFEIWNDDQRVFSTTLRHGESRKIDISVQGVLKLRLAACSVGFSGYPEDKGGGIFGDPKVIGDADKVPQ